MKIYTHLSAGKYHPINGEDYLYQRFLGDNFFIGAVMDGCSSGKESYFASTLYGKSMHKSCRALLNMKEIRPDYDLEIMDKESIGSFILAQLFEDIKKIRRTLFLDVEEILSTLILMVFDVRNSSAWINISGDGMVVYNGTVKEIDQNNMPDYLSYHLDIKFEDWIKNHTQAMELDEILDISISTDGIMKLKPADNNCVKIDPLEYLLIQRPDDMPENYLNTSHRNLISNLNYVSYDDMGIIRLIP